MSFFRFIFTKTFLKQLALAIVVLILLGVATMWWLRVTTNHNQKIAVPDLSELTLDKVEDKLAEFDLRYEILDSANYNPDYPKYSVIEQIPEPGKFVKENRKLYLTLNPSGYREIEVPDVLGKTQRQVEPTLLAMGFKIGTVSYQPHISDNVLEMRFKGKTLHPGESIPQTSKIDLVVGDQSQNRLRTEEDENNEENSDDYDDNEILNGGF